jgi:hypothetical protein
MYPNTDPLLALRRLLPALLLALPACGDPGAGGPSAPGTGSQTAALPPGAPGSAQSASPPASAPAPPREPAEELDPNRAAVEPLRKTLRAVADDPALDAHRDLVADRYGVVQLPLPLEMQEVPLPHARRALLLTGQGAALDKPIVLVVGPDNALFWSKERPLVGTRERTRELTLSRGPHGEVLLFWYDEPTRIVAAREWTHEGSIFADYVLFSAETCDGLSVLYWPGHGWVAALTAGSVLQVQLLGENGTRAWPESGVVVPLAAGPAPSAPAPAAALRPRTAVPRDEHIEITVGPRKVKISPDGKVITG